MTTNNGTIVILEADPDWFDKRRFVTEAPNMVEGFSYIRERAIDGWSVLDLKTMKRILTDLTGEDAGYYADGLEIIYNAYLIPLQNQLLVEDR